MTATEIGTINARRLETPGRPEWARSVQPGADERYLVVTIDSHASEPANVYELGGIDRRYLDRVPHLVIDDEGRHLMHVEGWNRPQLVKGRPKHTEFEAQWERDELSSTGQMWSERMEPDDIARMQASSTQRADQPGLARMHADMTADGVDAAVVFGNRGLLGYATYDDDFAYAMCRAYNQWAHDIYGPHVDRFAAVANLVTADVDRRRRRARLDRRPRLPGPQHPVQATRHGDPEPDDLSYNHPSFDRLWAALEETGLPVCMHVATGRDPRAATGSGGAIINKATGFLNGVMTPLAELLASGVFERFPRLRFVTVEADIGGSRGCSRPLDHAVLQAPHVGATVAPGATEPLLPDRTAPPRSSRTAPG